MTKPGMVAVELLAQVTLALAVGLCVSVVLAGAALLLAGSDGTEPHYAQSAPQPRTAR